MTLLELSADICFQISNPTYAVTAMAMMPHQKNNKWILYPDRMLTLKNLTKIVIRVFVTRNLSRFLP